MANARIALGGEIDIASGKELDSGLKSLRDSMNGVLAKPKRIMRPLSVAQTFSGIAVGDTLQLSAGTPAAGRIWVVTRILVLGSDDSTAVTGALAAVYIGDPANVGLSQCVKPGAAIPFIDTQNEHSYVVHDRESLFINVSATAAVAAGQVVLNALAWEYKDRDIDTQVI